MPDNVGYTPGAGATVAADEIDGVLHQRMKLSIGVDGFAVDASALNPVPIVDDSIPLLLRIVKLLEPLATQDQQQRQRVTLDAIPAGVTLPAVTTVTGVTTVSTVTTVTTVATVASQTSLAGMDREMYINIARNTYANAIRSKLT